MTELNKIYNMDCFEGMKYIPAKSVDLILTDPPYATTQNKWDKGIDLGVMFREFNRIIKDNGCMAIMCQQPFTTDLITANRKLFRYEWVWDKRTSTGFLNANRMPLKRHETIAVFYKHLPTYNPQFTEGKPYTIVQGRGSSNWRYNETQGGHITENDGRRYPTDIIDIPSKKGFLGSGGGMPSHPTQKPVELFEYLIKTYSNEGDIVLDAFMGSGTTAVACINLNRQFIGFETDEKYYNMALERVKRVQEKETEK